MRRRSAEYGSAAGLRNPRRPTARRPPTAVPAGETTETGWRRGLAGSLAFLRRRMTGDYQVDDFGYDPDFTDHVLVPPLKVLYEKWFRIETLGMENIPDTGGALLVANHSGHRRGRCADDGGGACASTIRCTARCGCSAPTWSSRPRSSGRSARKAGNTLACNPDAERLLSSGELVAVFPEGFKGVGKPYSQRYKLQRFGRGGFVTAALQDRRADHPGVDRRRRGDLPADRQHQAAGPGAGLPVLPGDPDVPAGSGRWARSRCPASGSSNSASRSRPTATRDNAADDPMVVFNLTDRVRETIQQTLYRLLLRRGHPFLG